MSLTIEEAECRHEDMVRGQKWRGSLAEYFYKCRTHGNYKQLFHVHHSGSGCPKCALSREYRPISCVDCGKKSQRKSPKQIRCRSCAEKEAKAYAKRLWEKEKKNRKPFPCPGVKGKPCGLQVKPFSHRRRCESCAEENLRLKINALARSHYQKHKLELRAQARANYQPAPRYIICTDCGKQTNRSGATQKRCKPCQRKHKNEINNARLRAQKRRYVCRIHGLYYRRIYAPKHCPHCAQIKGHLAKRLTIAEMERRAPDMMRGQECEGVLAKYRFLCSTHGEYLQGYSVHVDGDHGCPKHHQSRGERRTAAWLSSRFQGDRFEAQKTFDTCRHKKPLRFDFGSESLKTLIEYNGQQHYLPASNFGGKVALKRTRQRDRIKKNWARRNGYKLIVVPYIIKNIEKHLEKRLGHLLPAALPQLSQAA